MPVESLCKHRTCAEARRCTLLGQILRSLLTGIYNAEGDMRRWRTLAFQRRVAGLLAVSNNNNITRTFHVNKLSPFHLVQPVKKPVQTSSEASGRQLEEVAIDFLPY